MQKLTNEQYWLVLTIFMTSLFCVPYIINRMLEQGILNAFWDRSANTETSKPWANRMISAHYNAVENLIIFAPLVILVELDNLSIYKHRNSLYDLLYCKNDSFYCLQPCHSFVSSAF